MFSNQKAEISINRPVSAAESLRGDRVNSKFVIGTSSLRASEDNHLLLLKFHSDANHIGIDATLAHPTGPVKHIQTSPSDSSYVITTSEQSTESPVGTAAATLWKIPSNVTEPTDDDYENDMGNDDDGGDNDDYYDRDRSRSDNDDNEDVGTVIKMEERATLNASATTSSGANIVDVKWRGTAWDEDPSQSTMGDVVTLCSDGTLTQWDVSFGSVESTRRCVVDVNDNNNNSSSSSSTPRWNLPARMSWDPHHAEIIAYSTGDIVRLVDWREAPTIASSLQTTGGVLAGRSSLSGHPHHRYGITDLDYNPNKPNTIVTSGKDGLLKFWDLRKKQRPVLVARGGHNHWTSTCAYNPFHDQLVLSAGTDSLVNLWRMSTISSAPLLTLDDAQFDNNDTFATSSIERTTTKDLKEENQTAQPSENPNVRVSRYEHMDAVSAIAWGAADAWIYMSASFDGKVILNHVPSKEKYKILL